jgi:hypothetical protein
VQRSCPFHCEPGGPSRHGGGPTHRNRGRLILLKLDWVVANVGSALEGTDASVGESSFIRWRRLILKIVSERLLKIVGQRMHARGSCGSACKRAGRAFEAGGTPAVPVGRGTLGSSEMRITRSLKNGPGDWGRTRTIGSCINAAAARWLIRRDVGFPDRLSQLNDNHRHHQSG